MQKDLLFLSGEFSLSLTLVMLSDRWKHSMSAHKIQNHTNYFSYNDIGKYTGCIYYASVEDDDVINNYETLKQFNCWPDPEFMLKLKNRHEVMQMCINEKLCESNVIVSDNTKITIPWDKAVLKYGNVHSGECKMILSKNNVVPNTIKGLFTLEPFYEGRSIRIMHIENEIYAFETLNESNWIKNAAGGECYDIHPPKLLVEHSSRVKDFFEAEICGNDYILSNDGKTFSFLEFNQFPDVAATDEIKASCKKFFSKKMKEIENKI